MGPSWLSGCRYHPCPGPHEDSPSGWWPAAPSVEHNPLMLGGPILLPGQRISVLSPMGGPGGVEGLTCIPGASPLSTQAGGAPLGQHWRSRAHRRRARGPGCQGRQIGRAHV